MTGAGTFNDPAAATLDSPSIPTRHAPSFQCSVMKHESEGSTKEPSLDEQVPPLRQSFGADKVNRISVPYTFL